MAVLEGYGYGIGEWLVLGLGHRSMAMVMV